MPSAAFLMYSGIMPLIKTFITIIAGFVLAKMYYFPKSASRGASQVTMNVALPALIFANVIPAFTPSNIWSLGPLFLVAFTYQAIGFLCGLLVREFCYVPRNFWQGVIVMTGMSNWGNLPNVVVLSIMQQAPFNPKTDPALGVSYVSIFIVAYHVVFWIGGAAHSLSWDYQPGIPQGQAAEVRVSWKEKPLGSLITRYILHQEVPNSFATAETNTAKDDVEKSISEKENGASIGSAAQSVLVSEFPSQSEAHGVNPDPDVQLARKTSRLSTTTAPVQHRRSSLSASVAPSAVPPVPPPTPAVSLRNVDTQSIAQRSETLNTPTLPQKIVRVFRPLGAIVTPVTCALAVSLPIALIQPLKALFVNVSATGGPNFAGPDGRPPLSFMIDTANFMGGITVPLGLILLGASFARITMPRPLSRLPIMAMFLTTMAKMVILPVIGVFLVRAMTKTGLVHKDEKVLQFVMMFLSGTPTAVNQLIVASLYSPDGNVDNLSAFLLVQYIFMFFSSSALTAVALLLL
ncbi:auxin efflux carrier [Ganoderma leucocontextum]|nr:auxin efflux carrier [Ganoderma leucocontextum]